MSKEKAIIIFTVTIDVIGLGIIIPVLPVYVESFGLNALSVTILFSVYSLFSFLSAPFLGILSDKIGRRPVLIASIASTSLGWFIFALGRSMPVLLLGRIIDGLAAGNISTAQSSISDISKNPKDRAGNLGIIGMIFGIGFVIGPFLGGILSQVSHSFPFIFVGLLSLLNAILAYLFLPETNKHIDSNKIISWNPFKPLVSAIKNTHLRAHYIVWFMFNVVAVGSNTIFAMYIGKSYGYSPFITGLFFTGIGIVLAVNQGYLLRNFWLKKFNSRPLIQLMFILFITGYLLMSIPNVYCFVFGMGLYAIAQSVLGVAMTSEVVGEANISERGEAVGVLSSIGSIANILGPIGAGLAFQTRLNLPYQLASAICLAALVIILKTKTTHHPTPESDELAEEVTA